MDKAKIGLIGLAVMGQNLVRNFANKGIPIAVFNRTTSKMENFVQSFSDIPIIGKKTIEEFVLTIERPRKIILLVQAGTAVDAMIETILPHLDADDIIIDGGNSYFQDTIRRHAYLREKNIRFLGMGVSGGEKGALEGPSLMPGGDRETYAELETLLTKVAAQDPAPCVDFIGSGGAGHFVKMVHNGIEYADMQLIAEVYDIAKYVFNFSEDDVIKLFDYFQTTDLNSYLIDITTKILRVRDPESGKLLVNLVKDEAKGKGTGTWTVQESAAIGSAVPAIAAALDLRNISSNIELRKTFARLFGSDFHKITHEFTSDEVRKMLAGVLLVGKVLAYEQGFSMLRIADNTYKFELRLSSIAKIWRNGCIIRSTMLDEMSRALENDNLISLIEDTYFKVRIADNIKFMRNIVAYAVTAGIPTPALCTSLSYFDTLRSQRLPAALIQAQRDFFGAHTYQRIDKAGDFHTQWE